MKKNLLIQFLVMIILGSLSHFAYEYSQCSIIFKYLAPINESVFEHTKLFLIPFFIIMFYQISVKNVDNSFYLAKFISLLTMMVLVIVLYYGYTFFIDSNLIIDISIFIFSSLIGVLVDNYLQTKDASIFIRYLGIILLLLLIITIIYLTNNPLNLDLFKSEVAPKCLTDLLD